MSWNRAHYLPSLRVAVTILIVTVAAFGGCISKGNIAARKANSVGTLKAFSREPDSYVHLGNRGDIINKNVNEVIQ